jgi:hypothetical protein
MKHALALILACCALVSFNGCAKMKGERIEFGHSYPCKRLRGCVYYITYKEDVPRILKLKEYAAEAGVCPGRLTKGSGFFYKRCDEPMHFLLMEELDPYREGFFGWF